MKYFLQKKSFPSSLLWKKQKGGTPLRSAFLLLEFPVNSSTDIVGPAKVVAHIPFGIDIEGLVLSNDRAVTKTDDPPSPAAAARRTVAIVSAAAVSGQKVGAIVSHRELHLHNVQLQSYGGF